MWFHGELQSLGDSHCLGLGYVCASGSMRTREILQGMEGRADWSWHLPRGRFPPSDTGWTRSGLITEFQGHDPLNAFLVREDLGVGEFFCLQRTKDTIPGFWGESSRITLLSAKFWGKLLHSLNQKYSSSLGSYHVWYLLFPRQGTPKFVFPGSLPPPSKITEPALLTWEWWQWPTSDTPIWGAEERK